MNGAIADPLASTSKPPTISITSMTGTSQYFLRARMNAHSSLIRRTGVFLKLVFHAVGSGSGRRALDPVTLRLRIQLETQEVFAEEPHHQACRHDRQIEHERQCNRADDMVQQHAEAMPQPVRPFEQTRGG